MNYSIVLKNILVASILILLFFSCKTSKFNFSCAEELSSDEITQALVDKVGSSKSSDSSILQNLRSEVKKYVPDSVLTDVSISKANENTTVEIYGIENFNAMNEISCMLIKNPKWKLPANFVIFFFQYGSPDDINKVLFAVVKKKA